MVLKRKNIQNSFIKKSITFGVGKNIKIKFFKKVGINLRVEKIFTKSTLKRYFNSTINKYVIGKNLKELKENSIHLLSNIQSYKGVRHRKGYPVRGQRTHTNAKTRQKSKKKI